MSKFDGFDDFRQDTDQEAGKGIALELDPGRMIFIHRAGGANRKYAKTLSAKIRELTPSQRRKMKSGTLDPEVDARIMREVYAESVIIGWEGITSGGEDVPFSVSACTEFLEEFPEVFSSIAEEATKASNFIIEHRAEVAKTLGNA